MPFYLIKLYQNWALSRGTKPPCWRAKVALGQDKQMKLPFQNYVCLLFVLSQWGEFCFPAWRFCTTWMASCKGPIATLGSVNSLCSGNEPARARSSLLLYTPLLYCPLAVRSAHVISCCLAQAKKKKATSGSHDSEISRSFNSFIIFYPDSSSLLDQVRLWLFVTLNLRAVDEILWCCH